jgi:hypothetical protein
MLAAKIVFYAWRREHVLWKQKPLSEREGLGNSGYLIYLIEPNS